MPGYARALFGREVASAALYLSNYQFAAKAVDYFHFDDPLSPVMHFWSLNVEEQFYIVWPLTLLGASWILRLNPRAVALLLLVTICIGSFAASAILIRENQPLVFFHTETRCWELALGGLVAAGFRHPIAARPGFSSVIGWLGLVAIFASITGFNDAMTYPGPWALVPTLGTAAVLAAPEKSQNLFTPSHALSALPLRWIGKRSYSWYLWHWPAIVFALVIFPEFSYAVIASVPISLAIASLVFSGLEEPIRRGNALQATPAQTVIGSGVAVACVVVASVAFGMSPQFGGTASAELASRLKRSATDFGQNNKDKCHLSYDETKQMLCAYGAPSAIKHAVLFGDSHAAQWFEPINVAAKADGWVLYAWTKTSCPSVDIEIWYRPRRAPYLACENWRQEIMGKLTGPERPDLVFLSNLAEYPGSIQDRLTGAVLQNDDADRAWREGFRTILDRLTRAGVTVVVIRDTPKAFKSFSNCLAQGGDTKCDRPRFQALPLDSPDVSVAKEFGRGVRIVDLTNRICDETVCPVTRNGMIVYQDHHHLTATFSATLSGEFQRVLSEIPR